MPSTRHTKKISNIQYTSKAKQTHAKNPTTTPTSTTPVLTDGLAQPGEEDELQKVATTIEDETGITRNTVIRNIDKTHPIGQADENGKQKRIVKLTSDSFKEVVYRKHKEKPKKHVAELKQKKQPVRIRIKFQPSLTTRRRKLLELANEKFAGVDQI